MMSRLNLKVFVFLRKWGVIILIPITVLFWVYLEYQHQGNELIEIKENIIRNSIADLKTEIATTQMDGDSINEKLRRTAGICEDQIPIFFDDRYNFHVYSLFAEELKNILYTHLGELYQLKKKKDTKLHGDKLIAFLKEEKHLHNFHSSTIAYLNGLEDIYGKWGWRQYSNYIKEKTGISRRNTGTNFNRWVEANYKHQSILGAIWHAFHFIDNIDKILNYKTMRKIIGLETEKGLYWNTWSLTSMPNSFYYTLGDTIKEQLYIREDLVYENYLSCDLEFSINGGVFEKPNPMWSTHYYVDSFPKTGTQKIEIVVHKKIPFSNEYEILTDTLEYEVIEPTIEFTGFNSRLISTHTSTILDIFSGCSNADLNLRLLTNNAYLQKIAPNQYKLTANKTGEVLLELTGEGIMNRQINFQAIAPNSFSIMSGGKKTQDLDIDEINKAKTITFNSSAFHDHTELKISSMRIGFYSDNKLETIDVSSHEEGLIELKNIFSNIKKGDMITLSNIRLKPESIETKTPVENLVLYF